VTDRLVIHIGDIKTGSTSIQNALRLQEARVPETLFFGVPANHNLLASCLTDPLQMEQADEIYALLGRTLSTMTAQTGVISAEMLEFVDPTVFRAMLTKHFAGLASRLSIIAYVRPHGERVLSGFTEETKKGDFTGSLDAYCAKQLAKGTLLYKKRFDAWRATFHDKLQIRAFVPSALVHNDVVSDFFANALNLNVPANAPPEHANTRLSVENLSLLRHLHITWRNWSETPAVPGADAFGWHVAPLLGRDISFGNTPVAVHADLAEQITQTCREDAIAMDDAYFRHAPMTEALNQFRQDAIDRPQSFDVETYFNREQIAMLDFLAKPLFAAMKHDPAVFLKAMVTLTSEHNRPSET